MGCKAEPCVKKVIHNCGVFEIAACNLYIPIALYFVLSVCKELNFQDLFNRGITWLETFSSIYPIVQRFTKRLVSSPNVFYNRQTVSVRKLLKRSSTGEIIDTLLPTSYPPAEPSMTFLPVPAFIPIPPSLLDPLPPDGYLNSSLKPDERLDASKPGKDLKPSLMVEVNKNPTSEEKPALFPMTDQSGFQQNYVPYTALEPHADTSAFSFDGTLDELDDDLGFLNYQIY